jgi:hypothetical protein
MAQLRRKTSMLPNGNVIGRAVPAKLHISVSRD